MKVHNISFCQLVCFLILVLFEKSQANVCQNCLCTTADDSTVSIDCQKKKFASINIIRFGLVTTEHSFSALDLSENDFTHIPTDMFDTLKGLRILNLSNNQLEEIHKSTFKNLRNLQVLNLSNNKIKTISSIYLPSLRVLDLSNNSIKDLDIEFHKGFPQLVHLILSHNDLDDSVNGTLTLFEKLKYLDLSHNKFTLVDSEDFHLLPELVSLNLSNNAIKSLENQQYSDKLLELNIGFNSITNFPTNLRNIESLNIEYNKIGNVENITDQLNHLKYLNLSGNTLKDLSDFKLLNLTILDLSNNNFSNIPLSLSKNNYPSLEVLVFNRNPISEINFPSLLDIKSLKMSNLSYVTRINENSFKKLNYNSDNCFNLTLTDNKMLSFIDDYALRGLNLCYLDLKNNQFSHFASNLLNNGLKAKFGVDLEGNPFDCNCSLQWMLDDFVPWLYSTNPELLNNLRCSSPENLQGKRMVHWYKWNNRVLCDKMQQYSSRMAAETLEVLSRSNSITMSISSGMLQALIVAVLLLLVLVIVGILLAKRTALRLSRVNRRF